MKHLNESVYSLLKRNIHTCQQAVEKGGYFLGYRQKANPQTGSLILKRESDSCSANEVVNWIYPPLYSWHSHSRRRFMFHILWRGHRVRNADVTTSSCTSTPEGGSVALLESGCPSAPLPLLSPPLPPSLLFPPSLVRLSSVITAVLQRDMPATLIIAPGEERERERERERSERGREGGIEKERESTYRQSIMQQDNRG